MSMASAVLKYSLNFVNDWAGQSSTPSRSDLGPSIIPLLYIYIYCIYIGSCPLLELRQQLRTRGVGWGGMLTFMWTCVMKLMLRHAWGGGWGGVGWGGMLTFMWTCVMKLMLRMDTFYQPNSGGDDDDDDADDDDDDYILLWWWWWWWWLYIMMMMMMKMTQMKLVNSGTKFRPRIDKFPQPNSGGPQFQKRARGYIYIYVYIYIYI